MTDYHLNNASTESFSSVQHVATLINMYTQEFSIVIFTTYAINASYPYYSKDYLLLGKVDGNFMIYITHRLKDLLHCYGNPTSVIRKLEVHTGKSYSAAKLEAQVGGCHMLIQLSALKIVFFISSSRIVFALVPMILGYVLKLLRRGI